MKDKVISFRLTKSEYQLLRKLSDAEGLEIKDYIKQRIFRDPVSYNLVCNGNREEIQRLSEELNSIKNSINNSISNSEQEIKDNTRKYANAVVKELKEELQKKDCDCASLKALVISTLVVSAVLIYLGWSCK